MIRYIIRRLLFGLVVILAVTMIVFILFGPVLHYFSPIDAAKNIAGPKASPDAVDQVRKTLGLDKPYWEQYWIYLRRIIFGPTAAEQARLCGGGGMKCSDVIGRFGTSFQQNQSVDKFIAEALPVTASLSFMAAFIWMSISIPIGIYSALRPRTLMDRTTMVTVLFAQSLPVYYFGLIALYIFAFKLQWFPLGGYVPFTQSPYQWFMHLVLPAATLALQFAALYVRMIRSNMIDTMTEDYVRTARAKGLPERTVVLKHALRNALMPIVTMFGMDLGILLGGAVLTEYTFSLQGLGYYAIFAAHTLDVPLTAGIVIFAAAAIVILNIIVDLLYAVIDPRIRLT